MVVLIVYLLRAGERLRFLPFPGLGVPAAPTPRVWRKAGERRVFAQGQFLEVGGGGRGPLLLAHELPSPAYDLQSQRLLAGVRWCLAPRGAPARRLNPSGTSTEQFICWPASSSKRRGRCEPRPIRCWGLRRSAGYAPGSSQLTRAARKSKFLLVDNHMVAPISAP